MFGVVPKVGLCGFPFEFFEFRGQFREVKDTSGILECERRFYPYVDECPLAYFFSFIIRGEEPLER